MSIEKPLATCQDCGKRFQFEGSELDAEVCENCVDEGDDSAVYTIPDEPRDADAYGDDRGGEMGVTFGDD
jgi:hypothetical protein